MADKEKQIKVNNAKFSYSDDSSEASLAIKDISLEVDEGEYVCLIGRNGSGKSTCARLINVLEQPDDGDVYVFGRNTKDEDHFWDIRKNTGCVFQNPDNQIVGTTVEEDVAFGPENLGIANPELRETVEASIKYVGLEKYMLRQSTSLSGGQKQRLAIAGVLAMKPKILILDEATAMLSPKVRDEFLSLVSRLIKERNITVVTITHDMTEAALCDRVYVLNNGTVSLTGTPNEVFADVKKMRSLGLDSPVHARIAYRMLELTGEAFATEKLNTPRKCFDTISRLMSKEPKALVEETKKTNSENLIEIKDLSYSYENDGNYALEGINLEVKKGEILAIVGQSGCGKTTLITHLNAINRATSGTISYNFDDGTILCEKKIGRNQIKKIREKVGLVFQYPEHQLFEESVYKDIAYGPKNMGLSKEEIDKAVNDAVELVGMDKELLEKNPFELSGGQKRRVAIAGVVSMKPEVLVLDEPAAGLDPQGRRDMFKMITHLKEQGLTIVLVSHDMDEVYQYADRVCVMGDGKIVKCDMPECLSEGSVWLRNCGLKQPALVTCLAQICRENHLSDEKRDIVMKARSVKQACDILLGDKNANA